MLGLSFGDAAGGGICLLKTPVNGGGGGGGGSREAKCAQLACASIVLLIIANALGVYPPLMELRLECSPNVGP